MTNLKKMMCDRCAQTQYEILKLRDENLVLSRRIQVLLLQIDTMRGQQYDLRFYTIDQAAEILQVSPETVKRAVKQHKIAAFQDGKGGNIRIAHDALMSYVVDNTSERLELTM